MDPGASHQGMGNVTGQVMRQHSERAVLMAGEASGWPGFVLDEEAAIVEVAAGPLYTHDS